MSLKVSMAEKVERKRWNRLPPLENGDRLTRKEFERRYIAMKQDKKAELIEGVVYMPSPVLFEVHGEPHAHIMGWLVLYTAQTPGVRVGDNATVRLDRDNEPQPDALLRIEVPEVCRSHIDEDGYIQGAPELIVEIAASSATYDLREKLNAYRRNGVQEYMVWLVYDQAFTWLQLENDAYVPLPADEHGIVRSRVFPGLWLAPQALLAGDLATILKTLEQGLQSSEHSEFVTRLSQAQSDATV